MSSDLKSSSLKVVFSNCNGFVTDFGEEMELVNEAGAVVGKIPRYGVWKESARKKAEVIYTTNDLGEAKAELS